MATAVPCILHASSTARRRNLDSALGESGRRDREAAQHEKLRHLHCVLRRLAADRSARVIRFARATPCRFRVEHGCSIYDERPQHPCREFVCGWLVASSPLPEWMRPDRSDMIMLAANFVWHGLPVDVIVAAGQRPKQKALDWLMKFSTENRRCLIYQIGDDWFAFGPPAFQARDFRAHRAWREAVGRLRELFPW